MKSIAPGEVLEVLSTDPGSVQDFRNFCDTTGDELLDSREEAGTFVFQIRKRA